ncbi:MAG: hypothetical protein KBD63_00545 [Bacteriovoracaceae bacterium]|nr:hypothetical protein [Bacteriovoracaceae bacterium]
MKFFALFFTFLALFFFSGCTSYDKFRYFTEDFEMPTKIFKADFNQTWQAVLDIMKRYDVAQQNQQAGVIKTHWIDNTMETNFQNSFSKNNNVKEAKFKLIINVVKGYRYAKEVSKVTIYRRQLIEQDTLQGWKEIQSDTTLEKTLLYRIERLLMIDDKLRVIDKAREKEQLEKF